MATMGGPNCNQSLAEGPSADILSPTGGATDLRDIPGGKDGFALWVRLLFSCLMDADFLDTEAFMDPAKASRRGDWPELAELGERFDPTWPTWTDRPRQPRSSPCAGRSATNAEGRRPQPASSR